MNSDINSELNSDLNPDFIALRIEDCDIPVSFQIYHGGKAVDGFLSSKGEASWGEFSTHVYFSANKAYAQKYARDYTRQSAEENKPFSAQLSIQRSVQSSTHLSAQSSLQLSAQQSMPEGILYLADARALPSETYVVKNSEALWLDDFRCVSSIIKGFEEHCVDSLTKLQALDSDYREYPYPQYLQQFPDLKTKDDFHQQREYERERWFKDYCDLFDIRKLSAYRRRKENVILVPGPIMVREK